MAPTAPVAPAPPADPERAAARLQAADLVVAALLGLAAAAIAYVLVRGFPRLAFAFESDTWFEGDVRRVFLAMTSPVGSEATHRSNVHPLFILLVHSPIAVLQRLGVGNLQAVWLAVAATAALWAAGLFAVLRVVGLRRPDAVVFALLGLSSASAAFWLTVPETYGLGSLSMIVALGTVALAGRRRVPWWGSVAASAASLSFVTTNWMAGLAAAAITRPWRRAVTITAGALLLVIALWGVQKALYPDVDFFIANTEQGSQQFLSQRAMGPAHVTPVALLFSQTSPRFVVKNRRGLMTLQRAGLGDYQPLGAIAAAAWVALLVLGVFGLLRPSVTRPFRIALGLTLAGQLVLVQLYGTETFLYALNFTVLLVLVAALAACTRARPVALGLAVVVAIIGAINNYSLRVEAADHARQTLPALEKRTQGEQRAIRSSSSWNRLRTEAIASAPWTVPDTRISPERTAAARSTRPRQ